METWPETFEFIIAVDNEHDFHPLYWPRDVVAHLDWVDDHYVQNLSFYATLDSPGVYQCAVAWEPNPEKKRRNGDEIYRFTVVTADLVYGWTYP